MNETQFNGILLGAMSALLPEGFRATFFEGGLEITTDGRSGAVILPGASILDYARGDDNRLIQALETNLGDLQDYVTEMLASPWPGSSLTSKPRVIVDHGSISIMFVDGDETLLSFTARRF
jgi:hypothetical protein